MKRYFFVLLIISIQVISVGQSTRSMNNDGVDLYKDGKFNDAEINFKKSIESEPELFESKFNLGDTYYKQGKYDEAIKTYQSLQSQTNDNELKAKLQHNIGNSLLKSQKLEESVNAYKNALKLNPNDEDTKYNLSYALSLLKDKQNQQKNDQNNKDQKNDNKQNKDEQNKDQNKQDNKDQKQDKQNQQNQNQQQQNQKDQQTKQDALKQKPSKISKEESERILNALKNNEKDLQKKLRKKAGNVIRTDKDW